MEETQVRSLGWEAPLDMEMATHSSILAWRIPWTEEADRLWSTGSQRVRGDLVTEQQSYACVCVCGEGWLSCVQLFATPWTVACQAPLSMRLPLLE